METDGGAYKMFDEMAGMISSYLQAKRDDAGTAERFDRLIQGDRPALNGGVKYLASDRHAAYVNKRAYLKYIRRVRKTMGWPALSSKQFAAQRVAAAAGPQPELVS